MREISLNELPLYSPWPARILGADPWTPATKTSQEIEREYEGEKWGPLLARYIEEGGTADVETVDRWLLGEQLLPAWIDDAIRLTPAIEAHERYLDLVAKAIGRFLPTSLLVELGAGYGSAMFGVARRLSLSGRRLAGYDFTASGPLLLGSLAERMDIAVDTGHCDFTSSKVLTEDVPQGAVFFTSHALMCVPRLDSHLISQLVSLRPKAVVLFDVCYEHSNGDTLLDLMRRRYIELNDYNRNLLSLLKNAESSGEIEILHEEAHIFGMHALLPVSLVIWKPTQV